MFLIFLMSLSKNRYKYWCVHIQWGDVNFLLNGIQQNTTSSTLSCLVWHHHSSKYYMGGYTVIKKKSLFEYLTSNIGAADTCWLVELWLVSMESWVWCSTALNRNKAKVCNPISGEVGGRARTSRSSSVTLRPVWVTQGHAFKKKTFHLMHLMWEQHFISTRMKNIIFSKIMVFLFPVINTSEC